MHTDEKIMLTLEKITHGIFKAFYAFEKRVKAIQRIFEHQASLAFNLLFIKTKKYKKKYSREEVRKQRMAAFLSKPLET
jgi:hypothetical protein